MMGLDHWLVATPPDGETVEITWRKFNALHNWFVMNNQNGEDNQEDYEVSTVLLIQLRDILKEIMDDNTKAEELLPTVSGFFFGDTEYTDYYFEEVQRTLNEISKVLEMPEGTVYTYGCWW
jgi:hypothetical protein